MASCYCSNGNDKINGLVHGMRTTKVIYYASAFQTHKLFNYFLEEKNILYSHNLLIQYMSGRNLITPLPKFTFLGELIPSRALGFIHTHHYKTQSQEKAFKKFLLFGSIIDT